MSLPKRILFSANDPGGAHAIAPVLLACKKEGSALLGIATGPARAIFAEYGLECIDGAAVGDEAIYASVDAFTPELFLAGTSGGQSIDKKILEHIRGRVRSVYILDFWNNYWQRFSEKEHDFKYLPDVICVMDESAKTEMIAERFSLEHIEVTGNPYFAHFADAIGAAEEDAHQILFISQPIAETANRPGFEKIGFDEFDVLRGLQQALKGTPESYVLRIRLHPREDAKKFESYMNERTVLSGEPLLDRALSSAGLIVGAFSPVLMQAAAAGKQVLSFQPGLTGEDPLPSNRLGLTRRVTSEAELEACLQEYAAGGRPGAPGDIGNLLPKDATERVLSVLETS